MSFNVSEIEKLLARCHRRCCICHKFCGFKMETHHIKQKSNGGEDDIENAIPLCFECHAEVALYNPKHPKGRKYTENELLEHKEQWLNICVKHPEVLVDHSFNKDIGPLEGMLLELELNLKISSVVDGEYPSNRIGNSLRTIQYEIAMAEGTFLLLNKNLKDSINEAYLYVEKTNNFVRIFLNTNPGDNSHQMAEDSVIKTMRDSKKYIKKAFDDLNLFINSK